MPRKTTRVAVQSSDQFVGTGVHAPSFVRTPSSSLADTAAALEGFLKVGGAARADYLSDKRKKDIAAGTLAAEKREVDPETLRQQEHSAAWVYGAEKVLGRARAITDGAELLKRYESEFDKNQSVPELRHWLDEQMNGLYAGADAGIAREAAPYLSRSAERILATHGQYEAADAKANVANALATGTIDALKNGIMTSERWKQTRDEYTGLADTKELGLKALTDDIIDYAIQAKDETILDNPLFEHLKMNTATRDLWTAGYEKATVAREKQAAADADAGRLANEQNIIDRRDGIENFLSAGGVFSVDEEDDMQRLTVRDAAGKQQLSTEKYLQYLHNSDRNRLDAQGIAAGTINFKPGWRLGRPAGETKKDQQDQFNRQIDVVNASNLAPEQKMANILEKSRESAMVFTPWERQLKATVNTPEELVLNGGLLAQMAAVDVDMGRQYAGDQFARLDTYNDLVKRVGDKEAARLMIENDFDSTVGRVTVDEREELSDQLDFAEDARNFDQIRRDSENLVYQYLKLGWNREQAIEHVAKITEASTAQVGEYFVPSSHVTDPEALEAGMNYAAQKAAAYAKTVDGLEVDPDDLILVPLSVGGVGNYLYQVQDEESGAQYPLSENQSHVDILALQEVHRLQIDDKAMAELEFNRVRDAEHRQAMIDFHVPRFIKDRGMTVEEATKYAGDIHDRKPWNEVAQALRNGRKRMNAGPERALAREAAGGPQRIY